MVSNKYYLCLLTAFLIWPFTSIRAQESSEVFIIESGIPDQGIDLINYTGIFENIDNLEIFKLNIQPNEHFIPYNLIDQPLNSSSTYWGRISISNHLRSVAEMVLSVGENNYATFYLFRGNELIKKSESGELVKGSQKELTIGRKESLCEIQIVPNDTLTLYFQLKNITHFPPEISPVLFNENRWSLASNKRILIDGLYQGFLWFLVCYSLAFYLRIKDKTYLYFSIYVFCFALYFAWFPGLIHQFILPETPFFNIYLWLASGLIPIFYLLFLRKFIHTARLIPSWDKWIKIVIWSDITLFIVGALVFHFTFNRPIAVMIVNNMILITLILGFILLYVLLKTKNILAHYFISGTLVLVLASVLGIIAYDYFQYQNAVYYIMAGSTLELTIFSLGLAKRVEILRKQKKEADAKLIAELKKNELLQEEVKSMLSQTIDQQSEELIIKNEELNKAIARLQVTNGELQSFAYTVAHDLKAPLRAVNYLASFIGEDEEYPLKQDDKNSLALLKSQIKKMDQLIHGVLKYSTAASLVQRVQPIDINVIVEEIAKVSTTFSGVKISYDNLPVIQGDEVKIHQVFQNLISNAVKFVDPEEGVINIGYTDLADRWVFCIKDNGKGIDPKNFERIFIIFKTITSYGEPESTGIGLTIVKKIVELHGGEVWVESEIGKGSTFYFSIAKNI